ncbi:MAG: hypothetical protein HC780_21845 [Leptolyngbyaceae cyanobacterium CSU_1_3]|nr:hypothetical protein [Leptolyngbyaceae cyanobacterium CSU_1_3]
MKEILRSTQARTSDALDQAITMAIAALTEKMRSLGSIIVVCFLSQLDKTNCGTCDRKLL